MGVFFCNFLLNNYVILEIHFKDQKFILKKDKGSIGIITAGTSDIPVAEEAKVMAEIMGCSDV